MNRVNFEKYDLVRFVCFENYLLFMSLGQDIVMPKLDGDCDIDDSSVGIPPLSDPAFEQALAVGKSNNSLMGAGASDEIDGRINPLAGMGLTDDQYNVIPQGMAIGENFPGVLLSSDGVSTNGKRGLEDDDGGRDGKKVWLKVIE